MDTPCWGSEGHAKNEPTSARWMVASCGSVPHRRIGDRRTVVYCCKPLEQHDHRTSIGESTAHFRRDRLWRDPDQSAGEDSRNAGPIDRRPGSTERSEDHDGSSMASFCSRLRIFWA